MGESITSRAYSSTRSTIVSFEKHLQALFENDKDSDEEQENGDMSLNRIDRLRATVYQTLTQPQNIVSSFFYVWTIMLSSLSVFIMFAGTTPTFQITPTDCPYCDENATIKLDTPFTSTSYNQTVVDYCACPPEAIPVFELIQDICQLYFTIELLLRITCYVPYRDYNSSRCTRLKQWSKILILPSTIIDFLAILPFIIYTILNATVKHARFLGVFRLFRLFLLFRLARFSGVSKTLTVVLWKSFTNLCMLVMVLLMGSCFFSTLIFWVERGQWEYTSLTDPPSYQFVRKSVDGMSEEISPFQSIPGSFYWFFVTVTTVGYGDFYPTSPLGKLISVVAVLLGLLVVAFPVSVFAELWSTEIEKRGFFRSTFISKDVVQNLDQSENEIDRHSKSDTIEANDPIPRKENRSISNHGQEMSKTPSITLNQDKYEKLLQNFLLISDCRSEIHDRLRIIDNAQEQIKQILLQVDVNDDN